MLHNNQQMIPPFPQKNEQRIGGKERLQWLLKKLLGQNQLELQWEFSPVSGPHLDPFIRFAWIMLSKVSTVIYGEFMTSQKLISTFSIVFQVHQIIAQHCFELINWILHKRSHITEQRQVHKSKTLGKWRRFFCVSFFFKPEATKVYSKL